MVKFILPLVLLIKSKSNWGFIQLGLFLLVGSLVNLVCIVWV